jgi:AraC family ethanolamine operon transcriptional activator
MAGHIDVFDDFHVHGASAPEWNQRYMQISPGVMRSRLTEFTGGRVHVFRKWLSERVVQQGGLPGDQLCFALPLRPGDGEPIAQGRPLPMDGLLALRGGADFTLQRPRNMELLAVTLDSEALRWQLDAAQMKLPQGAARSSVLNISHDAAEALRARLLVLLAGEQPEPLALASIVDALFRSLAEAGGVTPSVARVTAAYVVSQTHRMVMAEAPNVLSVATVCARLRISRRTLQNSFRLVAATTPLDYMRAVRLNAVRARLHGSDRFALTIGQAAADCGFDHLSHFIERYNALFGELPSRTARSVVQATSGVTLA